MDMLTCECDYCEGTLTVHLRGTVDHHTVRPVREKIDVMIAQHRPHLVILEMKEISFMDSSGLGLILGRYTRIADVGGRLTLRGVSDEIMRILTLAGVEKMIEIQRKEAELK